MQERAGRGKAGSERGEGEGKRPWVRYNWGMGRGRVGRRGRCQYSGLSKGDHGSARLEILFIKGLKGLEGPTA